MFIQSRGLVGVVQVLGKGGRERLVPMGVWAKDWVKQYMAQAPPQPGKGAASDFPFCTGPRPPDARPTFPHPYRSTPL